MIKFETGVIVATSSIDLKMKEDNNFQQFVSNCLQRYISGDWGDLCEDDKKENEYSLNRNLRLFSSYNYNDGVKVWIITEADRSSTTVLFPENY